MFYDSEKLKGLCKKHGIVLVLLYGSQASKKNNSHSDVDLGLLLENSSYDFKEIIKDLMDVFSGYTVDAAIINHSDPVLKFEIISNYKILFCKGDEVFINFYVNTVKQYNDVKKFRIMEDTYLEKYIGGERGGVPRCNPPQVNKSF